MTWICSRCRTRFEERRSRCPHDGRRVVEDLAGMVIGGRYTLRELIGVGGMDSSVWLGWQQSIQRSVAIKLLPPADDASVERFARGARIASNLNHPNITVVHDYGTTDEDQLYLVMELLEGQTLHKVLRQSHLSSARSIHIIDQVLRALDNAHRKGIVHRDIKPGNLYLTTQNDDPDFVKVLDFGIARYVDAADDPVDKQEITMERQICGTPQYMAPEQVAFGQVDARTDIYALGVVMYRMLTGRLPFQSGSHHELFRMHLHSAPPSFSEARADHGCPPELEAVVMRSLAKSPDERFASAAEMRMALRQVRNRMGLPSEADEPSMPSSTHGWSMESGTQVVKRRGNGWLYAALLILGAAVIALAVMRPDPQPQPAKPPMTAAQPGGAGGAQTGAVEPGAGQPGAAQPGQPGAAQPGQPGAAQPGQPGAAQPGAAQPGQPGVAQAGAGGAASAADPGGDPAGAGAQPGANPGGDPPGGDPADDPSAQPQAGDPDAGDPPPGDEPAKEKPSGPVYHNVGVYSRPKGAQVVWRGKRMGATPKTIRLTNGRHVLKVKMKGYETQTWNLTLAGDAPKRVTKSFKMVAKAPAQEPPKVDKPPREKKPEKGIVILGDSPGGSRPAGKGDKPRVRTLGGN